jgi:protein-L-isoaspartate O-methyltransferase
VTSLVQRKFGEAAADYAASAVHARGPSFTRLIELVNPKKPSWRVLDIATGAGHTALAFAPLVARVTASDITDAMLAEAKKLAAARGLVNFRTARASAETLSPAGLRRITSRTPAHLL